MSEGVLPVSFVGRVRVLMTHVRVLNVAKPVSAVTVNAYFHAPVSRVPSVKPALTVSAVTVAVAGLYVPRVRHASTMCARRHVQ